MYKSEDAFELNPEMTDENEEFEFGQSEWGEVFDENELVELTAELLEITDAAELDLFLGNLIKKAGRAIGKVMKSPIVQAAGSFYCSGSAHSGYACLANNSAVGYCMVA